MFPWTYYRVRTWSVPMLNTEYSRLTITQATVITQRKILKPEVTMNMQMWDPNIHVIQLPIND